MRVPDLAVFNGVCRPRTAHQWDWASRGVGGQSRDAADPLTEELSGERIADRAM